MAFGALRFAFFFGPAESLPASHRPATEPTNQQPNDQADGEKNDDRGHDGVPEAGEKARLILHGGQILNGCEHGAGGHVTSIACLPDAGMARGGPHRGART